MSEKSEQTIDELTYEEAFASLDAIIVGLESGDLPLDEALARYEEGIKLASRCASLLEDAELRVRAWQPGDETADVDGWQAE